MRHRVRTIITAALTAATLATGSATVAAGPAAAEGFPGGPWCHGPAKVKAESDWSRVLICPVQGPTGWAYKGKALTTGNEIALWGATQNRYGFHVSNNGYTYHVHPDRLWITGPDGATVSSEPWRSYEYR